MIRPLLGAAGGLERRGRLGDLVGVGSADDGEHMVGVVGQCADGFVVALAYPERVARRVTNGVYLLASGTRAALPPNSPLRHHEWLAVADATRADGRVAQGTGAVVRLAAPLTRELAERAASHLLVDEVRATWDDGRVTARRVQALGAIDLQRRLDGEKAHSGTHLVHAALHQILGPEATQSGSFNKEGYLRFDFRWAESLSAGARSEVEDVVNIAIRDDHAVLTQEMSLEEARALGAMSLFGEKYGDRVRVVEIDGAWSRELCGGTHVGRTAQIGSLTLLGEQSVGSGNRRVEALVGLDSFRHLAAERTLVSELSEMFKAPAEELKDRIGATLDRLKAAEKQVAELRAQALQAQAGQLAAQARDVTTSGGTSVRVLAHHAGDVAGDQLRSLVLDLRARIESAGGNAAGTPVLVALTAEAKGRPLVVVATNEAARAAGLKAGAMVKTATGVLGGGGGGKDDVAQGGGQDVTRVGDALDAVVAAVRAA